MILILRHDLHYATSVAFCIAFCNTDDILYHFEILFKYPARKHGGTSVQYTRGFYILYPPPPQGGKFSG